MSRSVKERRLLALPVNVHEKRADFSQEGLRHELIIDKNPVLSRRRELAPDNQIYFSGGVQFDAAFVKSLLQNRIGTNRKKPFNLCLRSSFLNQIRRNPFARERAQTVDNNRFSRTRFARQKVQAVSKFELELINQ